MAPNALNVLMFSPAKVRKGECKTGPSPPVCHRIVQQTQLSDERRELCTVARTWRTDDQRADSVKDEVPVDSGGVYAGRLVERLGDQAWQTLLHVVGDALARHRINDSAPPVRGRGCAQALGDLAAPHRSAVAAAGQAVGVQFSLVDDARPVHCGVPPREMEDLLLGHRQVGHWYQAAE